MPRIVLVHPGPGAPEVLTLEAWRALTTVPAFAAPDDPLAEQLRATGTTVGMLDEAAPARLAAEHPDRPARGMTGRNLLATHGHGEITGGARALAERLGSLAAEHGTVSFIVPGEAATKAVIAHAFAHPEVEVEIVAGPQPRGSQLLELVRVMARLRGPGGCPWDAEQTHETLAKHLLDETYELLEAIETGTEADIAEELGDLLLQVVFHAQMGADAGAFDVDDVARGLVDKLVRRHPHVFGDVAVSGPREVVVNWDVIKQHEKQRSSAVEGVPEALPALAYAQKLQRRAGVAGFDWDDVSGAVRKVREEAEELVQAGDAAGREHELGDLLFSVVALARHLELDAESALRRAAKRFRDRYVHVEEAARRRGVDLSALSQDELEALWRDAKAT